MVIAYSLELKMITERTQRILQLAHETGALLHGDFTLSSGKKSDHYFEGKKLTLYPEGAYLIGKEIFEMLEGTNIDAVGGLVMGAFPIITAVAVESYQRSKPIPTFIVREQAKEHGTKRKIEGHLKKGMKVAIVDDVITTGGSVLKAIKAVEEEGCKVEKVIVIVDRNEGGSEWLRSQGYKVESIIDLPPSGDASISEPSTSKGETQSGILRR
jgi:orotate phosphoribosyltransferase